MDVVFGQTRKAHGLSPQSRNGNSAYLRTSVTMPQTVRASRTIHTNRPTLTCDRVLNFCIADTLIAALVLIFMVIQHPWILFFSGIVAGLAYALRVAQETSIELPTVAGFKVEWRHAVAALYFAYVALVFAVVGHAVFEFVGIASMTVLGHALFRTPRHDSPMAQSAAEAALAATASPIAPARRSSREPEATWTNASPMTHPKEDQHV